MRTGKRKSSRNARHGGGGTLFCSGDCDIGAALVMDAFVIEPDNLQVNHYIIHGNVRSPLKIADLSDLHTRGLGRPERKVLAALAKENPDVILITGDTLADPLGDYLACLKVYKQLHAPLGVWFVHGNWENLRPIRHERQYYHDAGINLLVNQNHELRPDVWLIGLDDPFTGRINLARGVSRCPVQCIHDCDVSFAVFLQGLSQEK